jgi:hypothetical protein
VGQCDVCLHSLRVKPLKQGAGLLSATTQTLPNATLNHHLPNTFVSMLGRAPYAEPIVELSAESHVL